MNDSPLFHPVPAPEFPRWSETLRDRSQVVIRPIKPQDKEADREFIQGLSAQARRFRFLGQMRSPSEALVERLTAIDYDNEFAFVAVTPVDGHEKIVGVSRYSADESGLNCECAVTVSDEWQNKGLGTLLMKHLIEVARRRGIHSMISIDSAQNMQMNDLARFLGFQARVDPDDASQVIHELTL